MLFRIVWNGPLSIKFTSFQSSILTKWGLRRMIPKSPFHKRYFNHSIPLHGPWVMQSPSTIFSPWSTMVHDVAFLPLLRGQHQVVVASTGLLLRQGDLAKNVPGQRGMESSHENLKLILNHIKYTEIYGIYSYNYIAIMYIYIYIYRK